MDQALVYLTLAMKLAPVIIQAGQDIYEFSRQVYLVVTKQGDPSAADWAMLTAKEEELRAILQAPLEDDTQQG